MFDVSMPLEWLKQLKFTARSYLRDAPDERRSWIGENEARETIRCFHKLEEMFGLPSPVEWSLKLHAVRLDAEIEREEGYYLCSDELPDPEC